VGKEQEVIENDDLGIDESKKRDHKKKKKEKSFFREAVEILLIAFVLAFVVRTFVAENFWVPSRSMVPTIQVNDRVLVTKFSYKIADPERGDIVVFEPPATAHAGEEEKFYVKRLIALPGETVEFKDNVLYIDGEVVDEPYLREDVINEDFGPYVVPENSYFFCGDNRTGSYDSRAWGSVERDSLVGKGQFIWWPFDRMGGL